jgi:branched-chain amino acid transport system ATP-binding protein
MLTLENIWVYYGTVAAVKGVSIDVNDGEIVTLIGANGAGKTTTLRAISGLHHPSEGDIRFEGESIARMTPEKINALGIAMVPEGRRVFPYMTVFENLEMGAYLRNDRAQMKRDLDEIYHHFPILIERRKQLAGTMSGGQQQMLAMGRALMSGPKVLLLDEPSLGLSPIMCQEIAIIIKQLHELGKTIVLVEQNARLALRLAQQGYVLETGKVVLHGPAEDLRHDKLVQETYLGAAGD